MRQILKNEELITQTRSDHTVQKSFAELQQPFEANVDIQYRYVIIYCVYTLYALWRISMDHINKLV